MNIKNYYYAAKKSNNLFRIIDVIYSRVRYGLRPKEYSFYNFNKCPFKYRKTYLSNRRVKRRLKVINPLKNRSLTLDKFKFYKHCKNNGIPTIPILYQYKFNNENTNESLEVTTNEFVDSVQNVSENLFIKPVDGTHGDGALLAVNRSGVWNYNDNAGDATALFEYCIKKYADTAGWIVQPQIRSHAVFRKIMSDNCLGSIRIVTCVTEDVPKVLFSAIRIPVGDSIVDNFDFGATRNLMAPIDIDKGTIGTAIFSENQEWPKIMRTEIHPDTKNSITGTTIPFWKEVCDIVLKGQNASKEYLLTMGWDVAITDNGPMVIEANSTYDITGTQISHNKGIKELMQPVFALISK